MKELRKKAADQLDRRAKSNQGSHATGTQRGQKIDQAIEKLREESQCFLWLIEKKGSYNEQDLNMMRQAPCVPTLCKSRGLDRERSSTSHMVLLTEA